MGKLLLRLLGPLRGLFRIGSSRARRLYVGNLNYATKDDELRGLFETYGEVKQAVVIRDRRSGQSKGFGFVEMKKKGDMKNALNLHGFNFQGRSLSVEAAKPYHRGSMNEQAGDGNRRRPRRGSFRNRPRHERSR